MVTIERVKSGKFYTSPERLYLDAKGNVVKDKDPNRVSLLVAKNGTISLALAEQYGLIQKPEAKAVEIPQPEENTTEAVATEVPTEVVEKKKYTKAKK